MTCQIHRPVFVQSAGGGSLFGAPHHVGSKRQFYNSFDRVHVGPVAVAGSTMSRKDSNTVLGRQLLRGKDWGC